jgi:hypothetical protein
MHVAFRSPVDVLLYAPVRRQLSGLRLGTGEVVEADL